MIFFLPASAAAAAAAGVSTGATGAAGVSTGAAATGFVEFIPSAEDELELLIVVGVPPPLLLTVQFVQFTEI